MNDIGVLTKEKNSKIKSDTNENEEIRRMRMRRMNPNVSFLCLQTSNAVHEPILGTYGFGLHTNQII